MPVIGRLLTALRRRLTAQDGIVLLYALGAMVVILGLTGAALAAVTYDTSGTQSDTYQKQAYTAAEAGIQRYLFELNTNNTYWTQCVPSSANWIVNTGASETGHTAAVAGSSSETYGVMLLPAAGQNTYSACSTADPVDSMIQASGANAGTLRIASTGYAGNARRTVVAAVRQQNYLDYAYFTYYETSDPYVQVANAYTNSPTNGFTGQQDVAIEPPAQCAASTPTPSGCDGLYSAALAGANTQCSTFRFNGRDNSAFYSNNYGGYTIGNTSYGQTTYSPTCTDIEFINGDQINGPFHSNDSILICGSPSFGQSGYNDAVEFGGTTSGTYANGYVEASGCSGSPVVHNTNSTITVPDTKLNPPTIGALAKYADQTYNTALCVNLTASYVQIAQPTSTQNCATSTLTYTNVSWSTFTAAGANGVLYDTGGTCSYSYDNDYTPYTGNTGCGTVYVKGVDEYPLTIGSAQDIVIDGNITYPSPNSNGAMLGLIANGFVRVYHPVTNGICTSAGSSLSNSGSVVVNQIDAAILSLQHSFVVDNYSCGSNLGTLNVLGTIAQDYRGTVGSGDAGYTKNYVYDRRLEYSEPPHFLAPTNGAYAIAYQTECDLTSTASIASCEGTS